MTAAEQVRQFIDARPGVVTTSEIIAGTTCGEKSVWAQLGKMVKRGDLVRVALGRYARPGDAPDWTPTMMTSLLPTKRPKPAEVEPEAAPEAVDDDLPIEVPIPVEMAVWHTGEFTLRRDDQVVTLLPAEVSELVSFLKRCGMAAEAA